MTKDLEQRLLDENVVMAGVIRGSGIFARVDQVDAVRESILDGLRKGIEAPTRTLCGVPLILAQVAFGTDRPQSLARHDVARLCR